MTLPEPPLLFLQVGPLKPPGGWVKSLQNLTLKTAAPSRVKNREFVRGLSLAGAIRLQNRPGCGARKALKSPVFLVLFHFQRMRCGLALFRHKIAWETA